MEAADCQTMKRMKGDNRQESLIRDSPEQEISEKEEREFAREFIRIRHIYNSAMQIASTQLDILDHEFAANFDHSPIHHLECRLKSLESIIEKIKRKGYDVNPDNFHRIQDIAGIRVICNYVDDVYYLRKLLIGNTGFQLLRERDYIKDPKSNGYRSLHLIVNVSFMIAEGRMELPVEIQLRTIAMDLWASLEHELRYKSGRVFTESETDKLLKCALTLASVDQEMQELFRQLPAE